MLLGSRRLTPRYVCERPLTVLQPFDAVGVPAEKLANDVRSAFRDVRRRDGAVRRSL